MQDNTPTWMVQIPLTPPKIPNAFAFGIFTYSLFTLPYSLTNAPGTQFVPGAFFYTLSIKSERYKILSTEFSTVPYRVS